MGTGVEYQVTDDACQLVFVKRSQKAPESASTGPSLLHVYNFTGIVGELQVPAPHKNSRGQFCIGFLYHFECRSATTTDSLEH